MKLRKLRLCCIASPLIKVIIVLIMSLMILPSSATIYPDSKKEKQNSQDSPDLELYNTIVHLDSIFWKAYNNCDLETQSAIYSDNIEFYHDQAGLITSKQNILDATRANICGKIRRDLVEGSLEIYPIPGFGAIEIGKHTFQSVTDLESTPSKPGNFIIVWKQQGNDWLITKVVSLH